MSKTSTVVFPLLLLLFVSFTGAQTGNSVGEGDFCKVDADCDPPKYICSRASADTESVDEIKVCIRKQVFPLYGESVFAAFFPDFI